MGPAEASTHGRGDIGGKASWATHEISDPCRALSSMYALSVGMWYP